MDSGFQCIALIAALHQTPLNAAQLEHQFGGGDTQLTLDNLLRAVKAVGFKAKSARLKAALKANLGRRKAQTKARAVGPDVPSDTEQSS